MRWQTGLLAIAGGILGGFSLSIMTENIALPDSMMQMSMAMSKSIWGLLALAIVGPITEELLFREAIEGEMLRRKASPWTAIIVSALAFSIVHLNLAQGLYALPLGIMFGIIRYKTGNIILPSLLHILNNSIVALQLCTLGEEMADLSYAEMFGGNTAAYAIMLLSGMLSILLIKLFWNCHTPKAE
jgi:membrane protease YdiL (CAAX protease family)